MSQILLLISISLFIGGIYLLISKKNLILMLIGIELIVNAALTNFIRYSLIQNDNFSEIQANLVLLLIIVAGHSIVVLGIIYRFFSESKSINSEAI